MQSPEQWQATRVRMYTETEELPDEHDEVVDTVDEQMEAWQEFRQGLVGSTVENAA